MFQLGNTWNDLGSVSFFFFSSPYCLWVLFPWPVIEPRPSAVKTQRPNHWTALEFPEVGYFLREDGVGNCSHLVFGQIAAWKAACFNFSPFSHHDLAYFWVTSVHCLILFANSSTWEGCSWEKAEFGNPNSIRFKCLCSVTWGATTVRSWGTPWQSSPNLTQLEKACTQHGRPSTAKN